MNKLEEKDIPEGCYVNCPKGGKFKEVFLKTNCFDCEFFRGLLGIEESVKRELPFEKCFKVDCAHPMPRSIGRIL